MGKVASVVVAGLLISACTHSKDDRNDWLIVPGIRVGPIRSDTCEKDLVARFGKAQVAVRAVGLGEGETAPGAVVFPDSPKRRLEMIWRAEKSRCRPTWVRIRGTESRWKTKEGITLGTSLETLERLNGGPFSILGFGWDYGGTIRSWRGGKLAQPLGDCGPECTSARTTLRLRAKRTDPDDIYVPVTGDQPFASNLPAMRQVQPEIHEIVVELPGTRSQAEKH